MREDLRWGWLVFWLTISFFFQMPTLASEFGAEVGGYAVVGTEDYGAFWNEDGDASNSETVIRKLKLGLEFTYGKDWTLQIDGDFQDDGEDQAREIKDLWLEYDGFDGADIKVGQMKEPFGFERLGGYSSLMTNERSLATNAFAPGRSQGFMLGRFKKTYTWALGVFREEKDDTAPRAVTGRVTYAPVRSDDQVVHLGLAASRRDLRGERFQIKDEAEVYTADNVIRSPRFDADHLSLFGSELAWSYGPATLTAEAMGQRVSQTNGDVWQFAGGYVQAGWLLTGEHRAYDNGEFDRVEPKREAGAVELVARWSGVDARERGVGAEASVAVLGINYYWRTTALIRVNYLIPRIRGNSLMANPEGDAVTVRAQLRF
ncbi:porin [Marinobacter sp. CHS3-4]|uniref:OprO/OprP family phosphate-selective porin n=1 Tax=Marinobacter sp. CHS3-4 TaxID=3045174 RepID=UPI0024B5AE16|nr:porin [Marinobacter sp. CHS3-4]MDI9244339.1 porin [Marinobacter sp. CHS3-4]